jgi:hypothetical protein
MKTEFSIADGIYNLPYRFMEGKARIIEALTAEAKSRNAPFFDGPHTRLIDFNFTEAHPETEQKILELILGPIGWFDYSVARWNTDRASKPELSQLVDLDRILSTGSVIHTSLPNILDTATTLITSDGMIIYSQRGNQVSVGHNLLTSAVAENIHVDKDMSLSESMNAKLPSPFRAALRGMDEELSPLIRQDFENSGTKLLCLGLSYSLDDYHPNILFLGVIPYTYSDVVEKCRLRPGRDFFEGKLLSCSVISSGADVSNVLLRNDWTGGGKASFFRAVEFIESYASRRNISVYIPVVNENSVKLDYPHPQ